MKKSILVIILLLGVATLVFILGSSSTNSTNNEVKNNVEVKDGIQYVTVNAGGGYSPRLSSAKADIPTKLIVKTNGVYDCSSSLVINSINYRKILPQTGEEVIDLGLNESGKTIQGLCSMGMYSFQIKFL